MPRLAAARTLVSVEVREAFSNIALDVEIRRRQLDDRDARLASALVYGVLKNLPFLDDVLSRFLERPPGKLDPFTRAVLRAGAFQLLLLDRVPPHAVVSEGVQSLRRGGRPQLTGLVNAVLRKVSQQRDAIAAERLGPVQTSAELAMRFGLPLSLADDLVQRMGLEAAIEYGKALQAPAPVTLRIRNPAERGKICARLVDKGIGARPTRHAPGGLWIEGGGRPDRLLPVAEGVAVVQDEGSQLVGLFAAPEAGWRVVDLCAGRGGKAIHLADLSADAGQIVATDVSRAKLAKLGRATQSLGLTSIRVAEPNEVLSPRAADLVLVDAPCSGSGTLGRHPELRWKLRADRIAALVSTQSELLERAAELVRPGGLLVYAVCSELPSEGVDQIERFLQANSAFARARLSDGLADGLDWTSLTTTDGDLLVRPYPHGVDGFYSARLRQWP